MSQNKNSQKRLRTVCFGLAQTYGTTTREGDTRITGGMCTDKRDYNAERTAVCSPDRALNRVERNHLLSKFCKHKGCLFRYTNGQPKYKTTPSYLNLISQNSKFIQTLL